MWRVCTTEMKRLDAPVALECIDDDRGWPRFIDVCDEMQLRERWRMTKLFEQKVDLRLQNKDDGELQSLSGEHNKPYQVTTMAPFQP